DETRFIRRSLHPIEQRFRLLTVRTLKGGFPRRERPWAAWSLPGGPGRGGSSRAPSAKTKKLTTCNIPNPQGSAAQDKGRTKKQANQSKYNPQAQARNQNKHINPHRKAKTYSLTTPTRHHFSKGF
ncbi:MAG: hypothetical protein J6V24_05230, partial [Clostridia bacterium]|nr:hypothetical protein [Clostridia bacterium]